MANIKQQKKRILTAQRQRMENLRYRSTIKTLFNRLQLAVDTGEKESAEKTHAELVRLLDRSIARGVLHRNTAARKKARAARMLLQEPKTDATTIRKAKKKVTPRRKAAPKATKAKAEEPVAEEPVVDEPVAEEAAVEETTAAADESPSEVAADEPAAPDAEAAVDAPADEPETEAATDDAEAADEAKD